jgi:hypothetical protein
MGPTGDDDAPDDGAKAPRAEGAAAVARFALIVLVVVLAVVAVLAALAAAGWLGDRTFLVVVAVALSQMALFDRASPWWAVPGAEAPSRRGALVAVVAAAVAALLVGTDLGRLDVGGAGYTDGGLAERVLGRDLPPAAAYAAWLAATLLTVACLAVALLSWWSRRPRRALDAAARRGDRRLDQRADRRRGALAAALVGLLLVPAVLVAGGDLRERADRRADASAVDASQQDGIHCCPAGQVVAEDGRWKVEPTGRGRDSRGVRGARVGPRSSASPHTPTSCSTRGSTRCCHRAHDHELREIGVAGTARRSGRAA